MGGEELKSIALDLVYQSSYPEYVPNCVNISLVLPESHPSNAMHAIQFQKHSKIKAKSLSSPQLTISHIPRLSSLSWTPFPPFLFTTTNNEYSTPTTPATTLYPTMPPLLLPANCKPNPPLIIPHTINALPYQICRYETGERADVRLYWMW